MSTMVMTLSFYGSGEFLLSFYFVFLIQSLYVSFFQNENAGTVSDVRANRSQALAIGTLQ